MRNKKRVVVTGIGIVSSIGVGKDAFWKGVINGRSGVRNITSIDVEPFKCRRAAEVKNFKPQEYINPKKLKFLGRTSQFAIAAAKLAVKDANIKTFSPFEDKVGVMAGTTVGERPMEEIVENWARGNKEKVTKQKVLQAAAYNISDNVAIELGVKGTSALIPTACSAGNYAIGYAYDCIRSGSLRFALAGGAESFSKIAFAGFQRLYAMSDDVCRPFDLNRKGMMLGEGAGMLLLEDIDSAINRGANIYAEVLGYGLSCDAHHITAPNVDGVSLALSKALKDAGLKPEDVDYISAHGTGTPANDKIESQAIRAVFGKHADSLYVSSLKSMIAHTMGASCAIAAGMCSLALTEKIIPPTINYQTPDPECDLNYVPNEAIGADIKVVVNNGFAFGGNNCCVVFGAV
ncbi:MAG: beta-ketoacyl-[acyl-carrier-protein] synthase family protein [Candidatus Omnitrophota bacterium]|nr:beta-ketoacyl-[acyl-carrier-protein] synthase family protein [Candidatus Omnitrophota bacterium]